ncbi:hypothetical protein B6D12_08300 [Gilliamella apicola]|nr:hypothetical protein B5S41_13115 [Gilliamella apicola]OTP96988.1 hypothetical protein B6D05_02385 [Gilliamella apicola]OTQ05221.1 hypothetical protein B6D12_08300 [Gilliamella apicola]OTQ20966.1 hypothetical protein B6D16_02905 [Gilliamella apicola]
MLKFRTLEYQIDRANVIVCNFVLTVMDFNLLNQLIAYDVSLHGDPIMKWLDGIDLLIVFKKI